MSGTEPEVVKVLLIGSGAIAIIAIIFIVSLFFHQHRFIKSQREKLEILEKSKCELQESHDQLRQLAARLQSVREDERTIIAREIHDELGQMLTVLKMDIAIIQRKLRTTEPNLIEAIEDMRAMSELIDRTIKSVRRIATELRPEILDELGIKDAIEWAIQGFQERTGIICEFKTNIDKISIDRDRATALFRISQETLTNIARHSTAKEVKFTLNLEGNNIFMEVTDNGKGISDEIIIGNKSLGILGMKERALLLGGDFEIHSDVGKGTVVKLRIPIDGDNRKITTQRNV